MNAKLEQLIAYLDRDDVSEVVVCTGRPVAVRTNEGYKNVGASPVTMAQLDSLVRGTALVGVVEGPAAQPAEITVGKHRLRAEIARRGEDVLLRFEVAARPPAAAPSATTIAIPVVRDAPAPAQAATIPIAVVSAGEPSTSELPALERPAVDGTLIDEQIDVAPITPLVRAARQCGATDLHVAAGRLVMVRRLGEMTRIDPALLPPALVPTLAAPLSAGAVEAFLLPLLGPSRRAALVGKGYIDLAIDVPGSGRLRGNVSRQQGGLRGTFRLAATQAPTLEQAGLPKELAKVVSHHQGLVVIAGPNGHGKTTTMAALVDLVNATKPHHIITIEDPVEIEHARKAAVITQREVGRHTTSFVTALKASLREDPDVIVIGELRDRETVEIALTAAETGHLVLATMSTPSAAKTIDRLIDMFPADQQNQARTSIAGALKAVIAQRLVPARGGGLVPVIEMVTGVLPLAVLIREDKLFQLPNLMQRGRAFGMIRFEDSLLELLRNGKISEDTARQYAPVPLKPPPQQQTQAMGRVGRKESP